MIFPLILAAALILEVPEPERPRYWEGLLTR